MSKIYTLFLVSFISMAAFAAERPKQSRITIATYNNADITVQIDGRRYDERDNEIRINNVDPGYRRIQVYQRESSGGIFGRTRERLIYNSTLYVKPRSEVDIFINRSGRAQVREADLDNRNGGKNKNDRWDDDDRYDDRNGRDNDRYDGNDDRRDNNRPGRGGMSSQSFQSMMQTLRRESFDNTRLNLAKQMIDRNSFETSQVREVLQLFSFESNRLDLAKYAYRNTVDKQNYHGLYDVFSFSSNRDELSRYCNNFR